jgi:energy-coupling factor transporter ATP-binding protein EcfA2
LEPSAAATPQDLGLAASGTGLALALEQRSQLVLHGSCVAIEGQAVCLLGNSGAGKSTLAAALHAAGHALISDAMTAITLDDDGLPCALPGWPVFKLWPNTVSRLGLRAQGPVHAESHKLLCAPSGVCASAPIPVRWFVGVAAGDPLELARLSPSAGVLTLLRNHYLLDDIHPSQHPELLRRAGQAVAHAGVASLKRGVELNQLDEVVTRIERLARSAPQL